MMANSGDIEAVERIWKSGAFRTPSELLGALETDGWVRLTEGERDWIWDVVRSSPMSERDYPIRDVVVGKVFPVDDSSHG